VQCAQLALNADQRVDAVAERAPQALNRRGALHAPAFNDHRRDAVVDLIWLDEVRGALRRQGGLTPHAQSHPRVGAPAAHFLREAEEEQVHHSGWSDDEPHRHRATAGAFARSDEDFFLAGKRLQELGR